MQNPENAVVCATVSNGTYVAAGTSRNGVRTPPSALPNASRTMCGGVVVVSTVIRSARGGGTPNVTQSSSAWNAALATKAKGKSFGSTTPEIPVAGPLTN